MDMKILNPPQSYIDFRCALYSWENKGDYQYKEEFDSIRSKFYKEFKDAEEEIKKFCNEIYEARINMDMPKEKFEIREDDGKKHGRIVEGMIYDIQYLRDKGKLLKRKIYYANQGVFGIHTKVESEEEIPF